MKRALYKELLKWKSENSRKPLLLQGARQVGKTYLINKFAKNEYKNYIYLNFEADTTLRTLFDTSLQPYKIIESLSFYLNKKINAQDTLLFFDEIQAAPRALTSLKYFCEEAPEYHIIAAGSLLGVSVGKQSSFPVGKVDFMTMYPMNFIEYLKASGNNMLAEHLEQKKSVETIPEIIHNKLMYHLKIYLFVGGMPEVLQNYFDYDDHLLVRKIQHNILMAYERDFSKYTDKTQAIKTSELWRSLPFQLARENKKFKYSDVKKGGRSSDYQLTIEWLKKAGLINSVYNITTAKLPLAGYSDRAKFKIYLLDSGLLGAMLDISSRLIPTPTKLFSEYNGAFIENFVASELTAAGRDRLYYWTAKSSAEVDFILQNEDEIIPLEVKSGFNRNKKSLRTYGEKYKPQYLYRISPRNFTKDDDFINLPLYAVFMLGNLEK